MLRIFEVGWPSILAALGGHCSLAQTQDHMPLLRESLFGCQERSASDAVPTPTTSHANGWYSTGCMTLVFALILDRHHRLCFPPHRPRLHPVKPVLGKLRMTTLDAFQRVDEL